MSGDKPRRRRRRWPWVVLLALVAGGGYALVKRGGPGKVADESMVTKVKRGDLEVLVIETGKVQPREKVEVKSKVAGQVAAVLVDEGQKVKKGQLLMRLDPTDYQREVARAAAELASASNAFAFARLNLTRRRKGLEVRGVAQVDVDAAESEMRARKVAVQLAGVSLAAARDRLRYTRIASPMEGTVIERGIRPGEVVTPGVQATFEGKALLTIADLSTLVVKTELNQIDVAKVKLGQKVTLALDALPGRTFDATVTKVAPASTVPKGKDVDVFLVEATLATADGEIKPGMTADVRVHVDMKKGVLTAPLESVVREAGKTFLNKVVDGVDKGGKPKSEKVEVKLGAKNDREVEIVSGAEDGLRILIQPASSSENEFK